MLLRLESSRILSFTSNPFCMLEIIIRRLDFRSQRGHFRIAQEFVLDSLPELFAVLVHELSGCCLGLGFQHLKSRFGIDQIKFRLKQEVRCTLVLIERKGLESRLGIVFALVALLGRVKLGLGEFDACPFRPISPIHPFLSSRSLVSLVEIAFIVCSKYFVHANVEFLVLLLKGGHHLVDDLSGLGRVG